jgi:TonB family protein
VAILRRVFNRFRSDSLERELDEEIRFHLDERTRRNLAAPMSPADAAAAAREQFGSVERAKIGMRAAHVASRAASGLALAATVALLLGLAVYWRASVRVYELGSGVIAPMPAAMPRAEYKVAARRAKIQGTVRVQCVVRPEGACSNVAVVRSLDRTFGLDEQAVHAIGEWRFRPASLQGRPVPTRVMFDFKFALR